jgi:hypothetical protein
MTTRPALSELDLTRVAKYCDTKVPAHVRDKIRIEHKVRGKSVTIFECRPPWHESLGDEWSRAPIAQLRFDPIEGNWTLFWSDRNDRWHLYDFIEPGTLGDLLAEIDDDPTCIFWG